MIFTPTTVGVALGVDVGGIELRNGDVVLGGNVARQVAGDDLGAPGVQPLLSGATAVVSVLAGVRVVVTACARGGDRCRNDGAAGDLDLCRRERADARCRRPSRWPARLHRR